MYRFSLQSMKNQWLVGVVSVFSGKKLVISNTENDNFTTPKKVYEKVLLVIQISYVLHITYCTPTFRSFFFGGGGVRSEERDLWDPG